MSKAKSKLQKEAAAKKQSSKPKSPTSIKNQTSGSKTVHREVVVPLEKKLRNSNSKTNCFYKGNSSHLLMQKSRS